MSEQIKSLLGTEDLLPWQWGHWRRLYEAASEVFKRYNYGEIQLPIIEQTRLFIKGTGETTDIVQKEMYTIPRGGDDDDESITLRPESTPSVVRAYLEQGLHKTDPFQKFYYSGPMFRRERPQRGRLRQFHQIGIEVIGSASPLLDAETVAVASDIYREAGLSKFRTYVNSIGCAQCRLRFRRQLQERLRERREELCMDCRARTERNVLRVFDCKQEGCQAIVNDLPVISDYLCEGCREHYEAVLAGLERIGIDCRQDPRLVRGLDYYTRTVYEIKHPDLGARDTICGGGRYDNLVELFGGPSLPCVGFGLGVEPTLLAMEAELGDAPDTSLRPAVYIVCFDDEVRLECFAIAQELRRAGISAELDYEARSPKSQMRVANRLDAPLCLLIGGRELQAGEVLIKEMAGGEQWTAPRQGAADAVTKALAAGD